MGVAGLLLAAGPGTRFGGPKALASLGGRPFVTIALDALTGGGCDPVHVVVGAAADEVVHLLPETVTPVRAGGWRDGMGASLRAGLDSLANVDAEAVIIHLVDLPDIGGDVVARLVGAASEGVLARATYDGRIGHPVLIGRTWWATLSASLGSAVGAREFLRGRAAAIECSDLAAGFDVDYQADLRAIARQ